MGTLAGFSISFFFEEHNMLKLTSCVLFALFCGVAIAWGQTTPSSLKPVPERVRTIIQLRNLPATNIATTLQSFFNKDKDDSKQKKADEDRLTIVAESVANCILVSGTPGVVEEVKAFISQMDRQVALVRLEVQIIGDVEVKEKKASVAGSSDKPSTDADKKRKAELSVAGERLAYSEITTLDNQRAYITFGRSEPKITGVSSRLMGATSQKVGTTNTISNQNIGNIINMTPRVNSDGFVALQLDISDSRFGSQEEGVVVGELNDKEVRTSPMETLQYNGTLQLKDGQPMTISAVTNYGKTRTIIVTAHILYPGDGKNAEKTK
jgi:hypothetical protein